LPVIESLVDGKIMRITTVSDMGWQVADERNIGLLCPFRVGDDE
jgi:hypothetical protein